MAILDPLLLRHQLPQIVYGAAGAALDDPAELYHEASKLSATFGGRPGPGAALLRESEELQRLASRSVRRHSRRSTHPLPPPRPLTRPLGHALAWRRSERAFDESPLGGDTFATVLAAAHGVSARTEGPRRSAPSAGALYPLEVYAVVNRVDGVPPGLYHHDPIEERLETLRPGAIWQLGEALVHPELAAAPAVAIVTGMLWRSRFKYGLRAYRFVLLEAGHLVQNLLLACTALDLAAVPVGGFYDRRLEELLSIDGVNEVALYCAAFGHPSPTGESN